MTCIRTYIRVCICVNMTIPTKTRSSAPWRRALRLSGDALFEPPATFFDPPSDTLFVPLSTRSSTPSSDMLVGPPPATRSSVPRRRAPRPPGEALFETRRCVFRQIFHRPVLARTGSAPEENILKNL